jgi:GTP pyrophosphokinase
LVKSGHLRLLLKKLRASTLEEMLAKVGAGTLTVQHLERALLPEEVLRQEEKKRYEEELLEKIAPNTLQTRPVASARGVVYVDGLDDLLIKISQCCRPVPGDEILGFITTGKGVAVHKARCPHLLSAEPERLLEVQWSENKQGNHRSELFLRAIDRRNLLADISSTISSDDANILEMNSRSHANNIAEFRVVIEVTDVNHLHLLQTHLQQLPEIIEVRRL